MVKSNIPFKNGSISQLPEYSVWLSIRDRTTNKENDSYLNYGGRGITVCDDWLLYNPFEVWLEWSVCFGIFFGFLIQL